jgi:hypothetical protein
MSTKAERREYLLRAFQELHAEGVEEATLVQAAPKAALHDESFMRRQAIADRLLGLIGVNRPDGGCRQYLGKVSQPDILEPLVRQGWLECQTEETQRASIVQIAFSAAADNYPCYRLPA